MEIRIYDYVEMMKPRERTEYARPERDEVTGELIAWDRDESDSCERGTAGYAIHHSDDSDCQTW